MKTTKWPAKDFIISEAIFSIRDAVEKTRGNEWAVGWVEERNPTFLQMTWLVLGFALALPNLQNYVKGDRAFSWLVKVVLKRLVNLMLASLFFWLRGV